MKYLRQLDKYCMGDVDEVVLIYAPGNRPRVLYLAGTQRRAGRSLRIAKKATACGWCLSTLWSVLVNQMTLRSFFAWVQFTKTPLLLWLIGLCVNLVDSVDGP